MRKLSSLEALVVVDLPVLPYKVLSEDNFKTEILTFLSENGLDKFMVRTDSSSLFSPSINNATNTPDIHTRILKFFKDGYAVFIMHPGNTDKNFHSLNIMCENGLIYVEVVGPGFIATDLNRNNILHERIGLDPEGMRVISRKVVISDEVYVKQLEEKLASEKHTESYLSKYKKYVPISTRELFFIKSSIENLVNASRIIDVKTKNWIASLSFVDYRNKGNEPVFWDLYTLK